MNPFRSAPDWVATDMAMRDRQFYDELAAKQAIARMQADASMYGSGMEASAKAAAADAAAEAARYGADANTDSNAWRNASAEKVAGITADATVKSAQAGHKLDILKYLIQMQMALGKQPGKPPIEYLPDASKMDLYAMGKKGDPKKLEQQQKALGAWSQLLQAQQPQSQQIITPEMLRTLISQSGL